ncbi:MAG TPA: trypsin-like peptidase domain-containing protein [bacterium]
MKLRDLIMACIGVLLCVVVFFAINAIRNRTAGFFPDNLKLVELNDEISKQRLNAIVLAANRVGPAVVSITVTQTRVVSISPFNDEFFRDFFRDFFPEQKYQQEVKSLGSGVLISSDGYVLTNEHVVANATKIRVTMPSGQQYDARIIAGDRTNDLSLLKIEAGDLPYAELGESDDLMIGEWVIALGNPFGFMLEDTRPSVTVGVVSALGRSIKSTYEERVYKNMIQTDAAINPGNSGGPLINIVGRIVGINTFIFTSGGGSEGIGFARPVAVVKKFIEEAKKYGMVRTPWIGLYVQNIDDNLATAMPIKDNRGLLISTVEANSPADQAGIHEGDRIIAVNRTGVSTMHDWQRMIADVFVGDTLDIAILRTDDSLDVAIQVKEYRDEEAGSAYQGIHVENITADLARRFGLGYPSGIVVVRVDKGTLGEKLGLMPGDVILKVGGRRINKREDFKEAMKTMPATYFIVDRGGLIVQVYVGA